MGKTIPLRSNGKATTKNKLLSHIIQGIEAKALNVVVKLHPNELVLLVHDGFVSPTEFTKPMLDKIQNAIKSVTGIMFEFEQIQFS